MTNTPGPAAPSPGAASPQTPAETSNETPAGWWNRSSTLAKAGLGIVATAFLGGLGTLVWQVTEDAGREVFDDGPISVNVTVEPSVFEAGEPPWTPYFYYIPADLEDLTPPPADCRERRAWAWQLNGSDADETRVAVVLTGMREHQVSINNIALHVAQVTPLTDGVVAACPVGGASADFRGLAVDLDQRSVQFVDETPERITLGKGETEGFDIYGSVRESAAVIEWWLELDVIDQDERVTVRIDDDGEPFRTAGAAAADISMARWDDGRWQPYTP